MSDLSDLDLSPGRKNQLTTKVEGTQLKMPLTIITGESEGPTVFITTGIHGSEYPGTLAMIELLADLSPTSLRGRLICLHPVNTQAFRARASMILPEDGCNINQVFPGNPAGSPAERAAWRITEFQDVADFYLDLHSGDIYEELSAYAYVPVLGDTEVIAASRRVAGVVNVPYMVPADDSCGSIVSAARRGTPALMIERGGAGNCLRNDVDLYKADVINVLKSLGALAGESQPPAVPPAERPALTYLEAKQSGVWRSAATAGEAVTAGQLLGELLDYFGNVLETFQAEHDGVVLYRLSVLSANAGDVLVAY